MGGGWWLVGCGWLCYTYVVAYSSAIGSVIVVSVP